MREARNQVDLGDHRARFPNTPRILHQLPPELAEDALLNLHRPLMRGQHLHFVVLQLRSREPLGIHQRLFAFVIRRDILSQIRLRNLDVVPKY